MKKSEIEFNNLMFQNKIIALLQKTERLEQRRYLGKEKAVACEVIVSVVKYD